VLGPVQIGQDRDMMTPVAQQLVRVLLAVLVLAAGRVVSVAALVDALWGEDPSRERERNLQTRVYALRRLLDEAEPGHGAARVIRVADGYRLELASGAVDVHHFESLASQARATARSGDAVRAAALFRQALALWRGPALADVAPWCTRLAGEAVRLEEQRNRTVEDRLECDLAGGHHGEVLGELSQLTAEFPLRERLAGLLMVALWRCGRRGEALAAFDRTRHTLADKLGIDPGPELRDLHARLLADDPSLAWPAPGATAPATPVPRQLPAGAGHFAGRDAELKALDQLLDSPGQRGEAVVVTAVRGMAGVGKTALAVHWARTVIDRFPDGQLYANLRGFDPDGAPVTPDEVTCWFLGALGVPGPAIPAQPEARSGLYRSMLADRRVLLVLDNAKDAAQVRPLLAGGPGCLALVTSRSSMGGLATSNGARIVCLDQLAPDDATRMLAARLGTERTGSEPDAVAELIRLCAGLPLALAIVAARAAERPDLSLAALAAGFETRDGRGSAISTARPAAPDQRLDGLDNGDELTSIRGVFSWSLRHVSGPAARMFRLLGVHCGPDISLPAAASLAGLPVAAARHALAELSRASLVTEDARGRFSCHDLLSAYAAEQARELDGEADVEAAQQRLVDHYLRTAYAAAASVYPARTRIELPASRDDVTPERLDTYQDVVLWFQAEQKSLMAAVSLAGDRRSGTRGTSTVDSATRSLDTHCWQLAWSCAAMMMRLGQWAETADAVRIGLASAKRLGDPLGQALMHYDLGCAYCRTGEFVEANVNLRRALEIAIASGDQAIAGLAHHGLVMLLDRQGQFAEALPHAQEAFRLRGAAGDRATVAYAENTVGWICAQLGHHAEALQHCTRALDLHRESGSRSGMADTLDSIAFAYQGLGDHEQAIAHYQRSAAAFQEIGDPRGEAASLTGLGDAQCAIGQPDDARRNWERALSIVMRMPGGDTAPLRGRLEGLRSSSKLV
jgi:DNA-binding SARP family transcriptional activator/tetratricopeptide (TPR) repeat protein